MHSVCPSTAQSLCTSSSCALVLVPCFVSGSFLAQKEAYGQIIKLSLCAGDGNFSAVVEDSGYSDSLLQRDAELLPLYLAVERASNGPEAEQASAALQQALDARSCVDTAIKQAVSSLLSEPEVLNLVQVSMQASPNFPTSLLHAKPYTQSMYHLPVRCI